MALAEQCVRCDYLVIVPFADVSLARSTTLASSQAGRGTRAEATSAAPFEAYFDTLVVLDAVLDEVEANGWSTTNCARQKCASSPLREFGDRPLSWEVVEEDAAGAQHRTEDGSAARWQPGLSPTTSCLHPNCGDLPEHRLDSSR